MSAPQAVDIVVPGEAPEVQMAPSVWRAVGTSIEGRIGLAVGLVMLALIGGGRFFAPYSATATGVGPPAEGPSFAHPFGTDSLGRDVLSRFLTGGDGILVVPLIAVTAAVIVGGALGMLGSYTGGWVDALLTRFFDLLMTLPPLLIVLVIIAGVGTSKPVLVITVALVFLPRAGRVLRGATQSVVTNEYVAAAKARGERTDSIILREVLPNIAGPAIADFGLRLTYGIIFVSTLNFLGLGAQPPSPDWGLSVAESRGILSVAPLAALVPAAGIAALSVSFNLIADALTSHLSPEAARGATRL